MTTNVEQLARDFFRIELRATIRVMSKDKGELVSCPCGSSRYCPADPDGEVDFIQFDQLHAGCLKKLGRCA